MNQAVEQTLSPDELKVFCAQKAQSLQEKTLILLDGELGSGKTYLSQILVMALGAEPALSPTYSLINSYPGGRIDPIYHVDLYRLEGEDDLESTGFWDLFLEPALVIVEWGRRVPKEHWPLDWRRIQVSIEQEPNSPNSRLYRWQEF